MAKVLVEGARVEVAGLCRRMSTRRSGGLVWAARCFLRGGAVSGDGTMKSSWGAPSR